MTHFSLVSVLAGCSQDVTMVPEEHTHNVVDHKYYQMDYDGLDVLSSVDMSGSMSNNFPKLGEAMVALRGDVNVLTDGNYQFGFITADPVYATADYFVGPYTSADADIDVAMAPYQLYQYAGNEQCFAADYVFLDADQESETPFMRDEAGILIFNVSDEDEQSGISAGLFYDWLLTLKENPLTQMDVVNIATTEDSACEPDVGYKYIELSEDYMNKSAVDICQESWGEWIADTSFLTSFTNVVPLSQVPIVSSIRVYYDTDLSDSAAELTWDWEYDEPAQSVVLGFMPEFGVLIMVGYDAEDDQGTATATSSASSARGVDAWDVWERNSLIYGPRRADYHANLTRQIAEQMKNHVVDEEADLVGDE